MTQITGSSLRPWATEGEYIGACDRVVLALANRRAPAVDLPPVPAPGQRARRTGAASRKSWPPRRFRKSCRSLHFRSAARLSLPPCGSISREPQVMNGGRAAPIPYLRRTREYYQALGYGAPYEWAHYADVPFHPLGKPLSRMPGRDHHHRGALSAGQRRPGSRRAVQRGGEVLRRLFRRLGEGPRPAHLARRHRPQAHDRRGPRHVFPARRAAPARRRRPHRVGRAALSRRADQSQPSRDARAVDCPEIVARCKADASRRRDPGSQLPGLPSDGEPRGAQAGGERHRHRRHGVREGHRRARRRAALAVLRFSAGQCRGPAEGSRIAGIDARARTSRARDGAGRRGPPCSPRCGGATIPTGSSTTATSSGFLRKRSRNGAPNSTRARRKPKRCASLRLSPRSPLEQPLERVADAFDGLEECRNSRAPPRYSSFGPRPSERDFARAARAASRPLRKEGFAEHRKSARSDGRTDARDRRRRCDRVDAHRRRRQRGRESEPARRSAESRWEYPAARAAGSRDRASRS